MFPLKFVYARFCTHSYKLCYDTYMLINVKDIGCHKSFTFARRLAFFLSFSLFPINALCVRTSNFGLRFCVDGRWEQLCGKRPRVYHSNQCCISRQDKYSFLSKTWNLLHFIVWHDKGCLCCYAFEKTEIFGCIVSATCWNLFCLNSLTDFGAWWGITGIS